MLLVPGIHSMGIEEPRLTALAKDLAGTGVIVMTMALPDLQAYMITPRATDVIEDAVSWMAQRPNLAPDGRVGIVGMGFGMWRKGLPCIIPNAAEAHSDALSQ